MKGILKFKAWQLFLLIIIPSSWIPTNALGGVIRLFGLLIALIWLYSICIYGQDKRIAIGLPRLNLKFFKINILTIPVLAILIYFLSPQSRGESNFKGDDLREFPFMVVFLYFVFAMFQITILAMKTLTTIELNKEVTFKEYYPNLFYTMVFIVGIWILQPKVTRLIAGDESILNSR